MVVARWTPELSSLTSSPSSMAKICHRDSIGPPPDVRMVARWTLESSASISEPSFSLLLNKVSQPSQPGIITVTVMAVIMVEVVMIMRMMAKEMMKNTDDDDAYVMDSRL